MYVLRKRSNLQVQYIIITSTFFSVVSSKSFTFLTFIDHFESKQYITYFSSLRAPRTGFVGDGYLGCAEGYAVGKRNHFFCYTDVHQGQSSQILLAYAWTYTHTYTQTYVIHVYKYVHIVYVYILICREIIQEYVCVYT